MFSETPLKIGNNYVNFSNTRHEHPQGTRHGRESGSVELSKYQINTYHSKYYICHHVKVASVVSFMDGPFDIHLWGTGEGK